MTGMMHCLAGDEEVHSCCSNPPVITSSYYSQSDMCYYTRLEFTHHLVTTFACLCYFCLSFKRIGYLDFVFPNFIQQIYFQKSLNCLTWQIGTLYKSVRMIRHKYFFPTTHQEEGNKKGRKDQPCPCSIRAFHRLLHQLFTFHLATKSRRNGIGWMEKKTVSTSSAMYAN